MHESPLLCYRRPLLCHFPSCLNELRYTAIKGLISNGLLFAHKIEVF
jgi:hypothetical protein